MVLALHYSSYTVLSLLHSILMIFFFQMEVVRVESDTEDTMLELAKELIKTVLYAITDIETFQPKPRRITVVSRVYRLLGLKSTTPTDLFSRKVRLSSLMVGKKGTLSMLSHLERLAQRLKIQQHTVSLYLILSFALDFVSVND